MFVVKINELIHVGSIVTQCLEHASHPALYVLGAVITDVKNTQERRVGGEAEMRS